MQQHKLVTSSTVQYVYDTEYHRPYIRLGAADRAHFLATSYQPNPQSGRLSIPQKGYYVMHFFWCRSTTTHPNL